MIKAIRILGIDPGLRRTGWGVIGCEGSHLTHIADGVLKPDEARPLALRLVELRDLLEEVVRIWTPDEVAVEETFVNKDARATLKLGHARAIALLVPAGVGLPVAEYAPNLVKKTVVGAGHAEKQQIKRMVEVLLRRAAPRSEDAADALAIAICHAQHRASQSLARRLATA
ncbi:MAG: crossover junction endodeoxyribonuclease RuvC [Parvibaculaceae bacterium]